MAVHTGHRKRLKAKFAEDGFTHFVDHEILEALLFYTLPYRDTNPLAHALIDAGGSLSGALHLPPEILETIPGCPRGAALFFSLLTEAGIRAHGEECAVPTYGTCDALTALARHVTEGVSDDRTFLLLFDNHYRLLGSSEVFRGYYASASFRAQQVVAPALRARASIVVLVSTHANRIARPDPYEMAASRHMASALRVVGVKLLDHLILAGDVCLSLKRIRGPLTLEDTAFPLPGEETGEAPHE